MPVASTTAVRTAGGKVLSRAEAEAAIAQRLRVLGHRPDLLDRQAVASLVAHASGSERQLRADLAAILFVASTEDAPCVDAALVRRALQAGQREPDGRQMPPGRVPAWRRMWRGVRTARGDAAPDAAWTDMFRLSLVAVCLAALASTAFVLHARIGQPGRTTQPAVLARSGEPDARRQVPPRAHDQTTSAVRAPGQTAFGQTSPAPAGTAVPPPTQAEIAGLRQLQANAIAGAGQSDAGYAALPPQPLTASRSGATAPTASLAPTASTAPTAGLAPTTSTAPTAGTVPTLRSPSAATQSAAISAAAPAPTASSPVAPPAVAPSSILAASPPPGPISTGRPVPPGLPASGVQGASPVAPASTAGGYGAVSGGQGASPAGSVATTGPAASPIGQGAPPIRSPLTAAAPAAPPVGQGGLPAGSAPPPAGQAEKLAGLSALPPPVSVRSLPVPPSSVPPSSVPPSSAPASARTAGQAKLDATAPASVLLLYPENDAAALRRLKPLAIKLQRDGITSIRARPTRALPARRAISYFYTDDEQLAHVIAQSLSEADWPKLKGNSLQPSLVLLPPGLRPRRPGTIEIQLP